MVRGAQQRGSSVMAGWRVGVQGKCEPYVLQKKQFIAGDLYVEEMLGGTYRPDIRLASEGRPVHFQHDRATARTYAGTAKWLGRHMPGWIKKWTGKGADADVLDYSLFGQLGEKVRQDERKTRMAVVASAKKHRREMPQEGIDVAIGSFEKRVRLRLQEKGGYFEQKMKYLK